MATSIRQMLTVAGASLGSVQVVFQSGVGTWPMPGSQRLDGPYQAALGGSPNGAIVPSTDPRWDKRITSQFDMPKCIAFDTGQIYIPVCISQHDPYFHLFYTNTTSYTTGNQPIHIVTDIGFSPWRAYQGTIQGRYSTTFPQ